MVITFKNAVARVWMLDSHYWIFLLLFSSYYKSSAIFWVYCRLRTANALFWYSSTL